MGFIDDLKDFARVRGAELRELFKHLQELGDSTLTLESVEASVGGQTLAFRVDVERRTVWNIYVELATRVTARSLGPDEGLLRDALSSLHAIFVIVRAEIKQAGPTIARERQSLASFSIRLLNEELAPVLAEWHPKLADWETARPPGRGPLEHERAWSEHDALRERLDACRSSVAAYVESMGILAGVGEPESMSMLDDDSVS